MSCQGMKVGYSVRVDRLTQGCYSVSRSRKSERNKKNYPINCIHHQYRAWTEVFYHALILACYDLECNLERMDEVVLAGEAILRLIGLVSIKTVYSVFCHFVQKTSYCRASLPLKSTRSFLGLAGWSFLGLAVWTKILSNVIYDAS